MAFKGFCKGGSVLSYWPCRFNQDLKRRAGVAALKRPKMQTPVDMSLDTGSRLCDAYARYQSWYMQYVGRCTNTLGSTRRGTFLKSVGEC